MNEIKENLLKIIKNNIGDSNKDECYLVALSYYYFACIEKVEKELGASKEILVKSIKAATCKDKNQERVKSDGYVDGYCSFFEYIQDILSDYNNVPEVISSFVETEGNRENLYEKTAKEYCKSKDKEQILDIEKSIRFSLINTQEDVNCFLAGYAKGYIHANKKLKDFLKLRTLTE